MSSRELSEWIAYDELEKLPDLNWAAGAICWSIATFFGSKKRFAIDDFIRHEQPEKLMTPEEAMSKFRSIAEQQRPILEARKSLR